MEFFVGQEVMIPCAIGPGAFAGESLVTIELQGERITGFVKNEFVVDKNAVRGIILAVTAEGVTVKLQGSFFTRAAGRTTVPSDWASAHLQLAPV